MINYQEFLDYLDKHIGQACDALDMIENAPGLPGYAQEKVQSTLFAFMQIQRELIRNHEAYMKSFEDEKGHFRWDYFMAEHYPLGDK